MLLLANTPLHEHLFISFLHRINVTLDILDATPQKLTTIVQKFQETKQDHLEEAKGKYKSQENKKKQEKSTTFKYIPRNSNQILDFPIKSKIF